LTLIRSVDDPEPSPSPSKIGRAAAISFELSESTSRCADASIHP
jgi:hypothetical protein